MSANYTITVDVQADLKSLQQQLKGQKYTIEASGVKDATSSTNQLADANDKLDKKVKDAGFTYQQFQLILSTCVGVLSDMYEGVRNLDDAMTNFKKVSELNGRELDNYVGKLAEAGKTYGRTA